MFNKGDLVVYLPKEPPLPHCDKFIGRIGEVTLVLQRDEEDEMTNCNIFVEFSNEQDDHLWFDAESLEQVYTV